MATTVPPVTANSEDELIQEARNAISQCNWMVGRCASEWTTKYARGRTDADFGNLVGLSGDQIYQRRRVWETFGDVSSDYPSLKWSHFYVALNWDDAPECLQWAEETQSTVAEMKAWRRAQNGEDLNEPSMCDDFSGDPGVPTLAVTQGFVRDPDGAESGARGGAGERSGEPAAAVMAGMPRDLERTEPTYAPFRADAATVPSRPDSGDDGPTERPEPSPEQVFRRLATTFERCAAALSSEALRGFPKINGGTRDRVLSAWEALQDRMEKLTD